MTCRNNINKNNKIMDIIKRLSFTFSRRNLLLYTNSAPGLILITQIEFMTDFLMNLSKKIETVQYKTAFMITAAIKGTSPWYTLSRAWLITEFLQETKCEYFFPYCIKG